MKTKSGKSPEQSLSAVFLSMHNNISNNKNIALSTVCNINHCSNSALFTKLWLHNSLPQFKLLFSQHCHTLRISGYLYSSIYLFPFLLTFLFSVCSFINILFIHYFLYFCISLSLYWWGGCQSSMSSSLFIPTGWLISDLSEMPAVLNVKHTVTVMWDSWWNW